MSVFNAIKFRMYTTYCLFEQYDLFQSSILCLSCYMSIVTVVLFHCCRWWGSSWHAAWQEPSRKNIKLFEGKTQIKGAKTDTLGKFNEVVFLGQAITLE